MTVARVPLGYSIQSRSASAVTDARLVNAIYENRDGEEQIVKRPGMITLPVSPAIGTGQGQGLTSWNNFLISVVANNVYTVAGQTTSSLLGSVVGDQLPVYFTSVASDTKLALQNGSNLYTISQGTLGGPPTFVGGVGLSGVTQSVTIAQGGLYYNAAVACTLALGATTTVTANGHGLVAGQGVTFTGTLPTGMAIGTTYQVVYVGVNSFTINTATTGGGVGSAVATSGSSSGVKYLASPTVTFSASPGTTAKGTAYLFNNTVSGVIITVLGAGYLATPTVTFSVLSPAATSFVAANASSIDASGIGFPGTSGMAVGRTITYTGTFSYIGSGTISSIVSSSEIHTTGIGGFIPVVNATFTTNTQLAATGTVVMATSGISGPFAPGLAYLDGTVYVMGTDGKVYGSAINDPTTWDGSYLKKSSDPDGGTGLVRHLNYLLAFGAYSCECFYDAPNPVGSPLAVNQSAKMEIGCANGYSIAQAEQTVLWIGQTLTGGAGVYMMDGLSPVKVSTRYVEKYLNTSNLSNITSGGITKSGVNAYCIKLSGHTLYVLTLQDINITLVFDLDEKKWYQWTSQIGVDTPSTIAAGSETYFSPTSFNSSIEYQSGLYLLDDDLGLIYSMDPGFYQDSGNSIYMRAVSPIVDAGTAKPKFYKHVEIIGDKVTGYGYIRHSDNDYVTFSPYRKIDLNATRSIGWQFGRARRSAWELFISDNIPVRLDAMEIDVDIGEQEQ